MELNEKVSLSWDWGNFSMNVKEGFRELLRHGNFADVTLLSGDCQKIEAHRVIVKPKSKSPIPCPNTGPKS